MGRGEQEKDWRDVGISCPEWIWEKSSIPLFSKIVYNVSSVGWHLKSDTFSERRCRRLAGNGKTCYFPDIGAGGWQTTEKSTMKRECFVLRHERSLFLIIMGPLGSKIAVILRSLGLDLGHRNQRLRSKRGHWGQKIRSFWAKTTKKFIFFRTWKRI